MSKKPSYFDRMFIANPCPADWNKMTGNDQMRYCSECNKHVYNLSKMTRDKAEALVARFEGRLCARFERGGDGTIVTEEKTSGIQLISRRASPVASAVVTVILSLSGSAVAATSSQPGNTVPIHAYANAKQPQSSDASATLSGVVLDSSEAVIVGAGVMLRDEITGEIRRTASSDEGSFSFTSLADGNYTLNVVADGFLPFQSDSLTLKSGETTQINPTMQVGEAFVMGEVVGPPAQPLRLLYAESDLIVTARVGKSVPIKKEDEGKFMKTALDVSATIKGERKQSTVYVYHWAWGDDKNFPGGYTTGDKLLVFLRRSEEYKGYETVSPYYGVKNLPDADLHTYIQRIEELAAISRQAKPDATAIVEWLVRCAEQPATRWEGAYELTQNAKRVNDDVRAADNTNEVSIEAVEPGIQSGKQSPATANEEDGHNNFGALLTDKQKDQLKAALFKTTEIKQSDMPLIQLVRSWKDKQLVPYLVWQLRHIEADPSMMAQQIIIIIADLSNDKEINNVADEYNENASYEDLKEEEVDALEASVDEESEPAEDEDVDPEKIDAATAKRRRSELLKKFLAAVEKKIEKR